MYRLNKKRSPVRLVLIVVATVLLCCVVLLLLFGDLGRLALAPCTAGREGAAEGVSGGVKELLETRNFEASSKAMEDLKGGAVDERLVATLQTVANTHRICVDAFKAGHYFLPGVEDGPLIPAGYGDAGGLPNTHYYGRAADIRRVDFYPSFMDACWVDGEQVWVREGDFYGGWITSDIVGPFKGGPGTWGWQD